jgi:opacity protein-like surface antigen
MRISIAGLTVGLLSLAASVVPSKAADMSGRGPGSAKDYGQAGVPVPAPVPYEEHYKWYVSGGLGYTARSSGKFSASANINITPIEDLSGSGVFSFAVGRYITPSIRLELGLDLRTQQKIASGPPATYQTRRYAAGRDITVTDAGGLTLYQGPSQNYNDYNVEHGEEAHITNHNFMVNAYYEFNREGKFRPYVGAGVGLVMHMLNRDVVETATCFQGRNDVQVLYGVGHPTTCWADANLPTTFTDSSSKDTVAWGLAASLMAGMTYDLTKRTHLDIGYRYIWQGGNAIASLPSVGGFTTLDVGSRQDHEIKTALRYDLW